MEVKKYGYSLPLSLEAFAGQHKPGRMVPYEMTKKEKRQRKRAKKLLRELDRNPWIGYSWDEGHYLLPKKTGEWVYDD